MKGPRHGQCVIVQETHPEAWKAPRSILTPTDLIVVDSVYSVRELILHERIQLSNAILEMILDAYPREVKEAQFPLYQDETHTHHRKRRSR